METLTFKTTMSCSGCVATVAPYLDQETTVDHWDVNTSHPEKILTITGENMDKAKITDLIKSAGFLLKDEP